MSSFPSLHRAALALLAATLVAAGARADGAFDSGSNGSFGPLTLGYGENRFIDLPPDGIIHATTVTLTEYSLLRFNANALNTPVYLLATGDVHIKGGATLSVAGSGPVGYSGGAPGPGGWAGGDQAKDSFPAGNGHGPGGGAAGTITTGGRGNHAGLSDPQPADGAMYGGPLLMPLVGGSGSGGYLYLPGHGGGGAILIASNTQIVIDGLIDARGAGSAAAGAIRLLAPKVAGVGALNVDMGSGGGKGRIRVDTLDPFDMRFNFAPVSARTVGTVMIVFPPAGETLELARVAGQDITPGTSAPVTVVLPDNAPTTQDVIVRATNFTGIVQVDVVLTPRNGTRTTYPLDIDMSGGNPRTATAHVEFQKNMPTRVDVWTR